MTENGYSDRLLAIIDAQNRIVANDLDLDAAMGFVVERAQALTGAEAAVVELAEGDEMVPRAVAGTAVLDVGARATLTAPVRDGEDAVGLLRVYGAPAQAFDGDDVQTLELLSGVIAAQLSHASRSEQDLGRRDSLTGLGNRRAYDEHLAIECSRARRHDQPLTLCLLDLDGFKYVNDRHGDEAGDAVLRQVAKVLSRLRAEDVPFRIGGDQFAVLLPGTNAAQAIVAADRLADEIAARVEHGVTTSFGLADGPLDPRELHAAADVRLLAAKAQRALVPARA